MSALQCTEQSGLLRKERIYMQSLNLCGMMSVRNICGPSIVYEAPHIDDVDLWTLAYLGRRPGIPMRNCIVPIWELHGQ